MEESGHVNGKKKRLVRERERDMDRNFSHLKILAREEILSLSLRGAFAKRISSQRLRWTENEYGSLYTAA